MIVPYKKALKLLIKLNLPVYSDHRGDFKCHFRDVCVRLTQFALEKEIEGYDNPGIETKHLKILDRAWKSSHSSLKTKKPMEDYNSGKHLAA